MLSTLFYLLGVASYLHTARSQTAYANDFVDPDYVLQKNFGPHTFAAQSTLLSWAYTLASQGPWSVVNKDATPPSGTKHDFMSWAPYWWPDCSGVGNTTALSPEEIWTTCPYVRRDGQFNPDVRQINNIGHFQDMSEAVFYNTLASVVTNISDSKTVFENNAVRFIRTWFLDEATRMNPNLNYGQMQRGPNGQPGSPTGVLDLKGMTKITSAILILRRGKSPAWTTDLDNQMVSWTRQYIDWLETAEIALEEGSAANNHGSFYYNQLGALKLIVNDIPGAVNVTETFFNRQYKEQIAANGEQPLEASRTRPYHYRAYNLAAMITNARLLKYAAPSSSPFQITTNAGSTIQSALDYAMTIPASASGEASYAAELYPNVAAVASAYGDPEGKYLAYLKRVEPTFYRQPYFVWNQPFAASETAGMPPPSRNNASGSGPSTTDAGSSKTSAGSTTSGATPAFGPGASILFAFVSAPILFVLL